MLTSFFSLQYKCNRCQVPGKSSCDFSTREAALHRRLGSHGQVFTCPVHLLSWPAVTDVVRAKLVPQQAALQGRGRTPYLLTAQMCEGTCQPPDPSKPTAQGRPHSQGGFTGSMINGRTSQATHPSHVPPRPPAGTRLTGVDDQTSSGYESGEVCPQTSQRPPEGTSHPWEACSLRAGALSSAGASPKSYSSLASLTLMLTFALNVHGDTSVGTEGEAP